MVSIFLTNNDQKALIDECDYELISKYKWMWHYRYALTTTKPNTRMHRLIMGAVDGQDVDHINGNRLDNRRCNLRIATRAENTRNRTVNSNNKIGYKGVSLHQSGQYVAQIQINGKKMYLGIYRTAEEAHLAYIEASNRYGKEFSYYHNGKNIKVIDDPNPSDIWNDSNINYWSNSKYKNYLLIQRSLLQSMPFEWQMQFKKLLSELDDHFDHSSNGEFTVLKIARNSRYIEDLLADYGRGKRVVAKEELAPHEVLTSYIEPFGKEDQ